MSAGTTSQKIGSPTQKRQGSAAAAHCGACDRRKLTVVDYFNLGQQRSKRSAPLTHVGEVVSGPLGLTVRYELDVERGVVRQVSFQASTCVTLIAYCELLAQRATGVSMRDVLCLRAEELAGELPGVPVHKRDRVWLAVRAMQQAIAAAVQAGC
jgi:NifU-like protein involved in Fe-S cluster formation